MHMKQEKENLNDKVENLDAKVKSLEEVIEARDQEVDEEIGTDHRGSRRLHEKSRPGQQRACRVREACPRGRARGVRFAKTVLGQRGGPRHHRRENSFGSGKIRRGFRGPRGLRSWTQSVGEQMRFGRGAYQEVGTAASEAREDSDRGRKVLESRCALDAERIKK